MRFSLKTGIGLCAVPLLTVAGLTLAHPATAQSITYTYNDLSDSNANSGTSPVAINDSGTIVGNDSSSAYSTGTDGFIDANGRFTEVDDTNSAYGTFLNSISNNGEIIGDYADSNFNYTSFIYDESANSFTTIDASQLGAVTTVQALGVNNSGEIVGQYGIGTYGYGDSFLDDNGQFTTIVDTLAGSDLTYATGINDAGDIVGYYQTANSADTLGFIYDSVTSTFTDQDINDPNAAGDDTRALGINDAGDVVGYYTVDGGEQIGFEYDPTTNQYTDIEETNGDGNLTNPSGINSAGDVVGYYSDYETFNGFIATPNQISPTPEPSTLAPFAFAALGLGGLMLKARKRRA